MRAVSKLSVLSAIGALAVGLVVAPTSAQALVAVPCNDIPALVAAISAGGTVTLASNCTYTLTAVDNTPTEGPNGLPVITGSVTVTGANTTIARGAGAPSFRIFDVSGTGTLSLTQVTLRGGNSSTTPVARGGAVYVHSGGTFTMNNSTVTASSTSGTGGEGGGVYSQGTVTLNGSTVSSNSSSGDGGGLFAIFSSATTNVLTGSTISDNTAAAGGGGLSNQALGTLTVQSSSVRNNTAATGGGLDNAGGASSVTSTTMFNNQASGLGGGIRVRAFSGGGAGAGTVNVTSSNIIGNSASDGGGIYNDGTVTLTTSNVAANTPNNCRPVGAVPNCTN